MRTYPIMNRSGATVAFEIPNGYVSLGSMAGVLASVPGVDVVYRRRLFGQPSDLHLEFLYDGTAHVVWEPFGDNSRYWIGPKAGIDEGQDIGPIHEAFRRHHPSILWRLIGDALYLFSLEWVPRRGP